tara:strand:- start:951 stop:1256 length:306 start_codon:yes stop_codon:yes gene_type:complete
MTFSRNIPVTIRFDLTLLDIIEELSESEFDGSRTACVVALCNDGLKLRKVSKDLKDNPEKSNEIMKELNEKIENESIFDWIDSKTDRQKNALVEYIQMNRD